MKPIEGEFNPRPAAEAGEKLPAGVYLGKIMNAKEEVNGENRRLALQLEVTEGEYEGFYSRQYAQNQNGKYPAKYKGVLRLSVPKRGDEYENIQRNALESAIWAIEDSNPDYHWNWDEKTLKGLKIAFVVREFDWCLDDGRTGTSTEIGKLASWQDAKEGKVRLMKKRELKGEAKRKAEQAAQEISRMEEALDEDIPF